MVKLKMHPIIYIKIINFIYLIQVKKVENSTIFTTFSALKMFLNGDAQLSSLLLTKFLSALQPIHEWLYASSLLLTYDAKRLKDQMQCYRNNSSTFNSMDECNVAGAREWVFVKMIDFAHAFPAEDESIDTNYLFGINNLVNIFTEFLRESQM